jgi:3-hydroxyisobutyrate dehydrogenase-like beta-hydroxyacid dehydrogenase
VWAKHLHADGVLAATWNRSPKVDAPCWTADLTTVPQKANTLHICVSDEAAVLSVVKTLLPHLSSNHLVIQSTTIDPATSEEARVAVEGVGASYIEAPFTGSLPAAQERNTIFFLGASEELVARASTYFARLSSNQFRIGTNKQACSIKLAMNLQIASAMQAMAEGITVCRRAGISDETYFSVFKKNASYSGMAVLKEAKLRANDFTPQFSVKHLNKDLRLLAKDREDTLPMLNLLRDIVNDAEQAGQGDLDFSSIIKRLG